ncbi:putative peptidase M48 [Helianthus annuus]|nr:putative peptidase M48 [Helianthus annuus]
MPDLVNTMSNLLLKLPFSRRMEIEADYIGLLLMASAGYDPRVAPKVFEKLGQVSVILLCETTFLHIHLEREEVKCYLKLV